jgi:hypothetical protein
MPLRTVLRELAEAVADEAEHNQKFSERLERILESQSLPASHSGGGNTQSSSRIDASNESRKRGNRRAPAILDPVGLAAQGEEVIRSQLAALDLDQLRDIVADYGMDPGKLVMKWKRPERVVDKIVEISLSRARKGDAFRS